MKDLLPKARTMSNVVKILLTGAILIFNITKLFLTGNIPAFEEQKSIMLMCAGIYVLFAPIDLSIIIKTFLEKKASL